MVNDRRDVLDHIVDREQAPVAVRAAVTAQVDADDVEPLACNGVQEVAVQGSMGRDTRQEQDQRVFRGALVQFAVERQRTDVGGLGLSGAGVEGGIGHGSFPSGCATIPPRG